MSHFFAQDSVRRVDCHPTNPALFLSASEDGMVHQYDLRSSSSKSAFTVGENTDINDAIYHPLTPELFASCDGEGRMLLIDSRSIGEGDILSKIAVVNVRCTFFPLVRLHHLTTIAHYSVLSDDSMQLS